MLKSTVYKPHTHKISRRQQHSKSYPNGPRRTNYQLKVNYQSWAFGIVVKMMHPGSECPSSSCGWHLGSTPDASLLLRHTSRWTQQVMAEAAGSTPSVWDPEGSSQYLASCQPYCSCCGHLGTKPTEKTTLCLPKYKQICSLMAFSRTLPWMGMFRCLNNP